MFLFKKKKVVLNCYTYRPDVYSYFPIERSSKHIPEWWKKLPNQVLLNFNESLLKIGTRAINKISILGPKGEYGVGVTTVSGRQILRNVRTSNDKGKFLIIWRAVSEDGHVVNGHINFKVI